MLTPRNRHRDESLISFLNRLESIKLKMPRFQRHKNEIETELALVIDGIKQYIKQVKNQTIMLKDLQIEAERLKEEKSHMSEKHNQILEALEILIYQGDQQEMKRKIDYYKAKPLEESFLTFVTQEISQNGSTLNRAFVMDSEEEKGYSEFSHFGDQNTQKIVEDQLEKVKLKSALKIVKDQDQPFEKREQAWLGIVYTKNAKQQSELFDSGKVLNSCSSRNLQSFSEISLTQHCQRYSKEKSKDLMTFSGKKIKSMALLKEKSAKKKSIPKTSVKKSTETHRELENAEGSDQKCLKRKLNFVHKTNEKDSKKKSFKNQQNFIARSFKKQSQNHN